MGNLLLYEMERHQYDANVGIIDELIHSGKITDINVSGGRRYGATHSNN
jgi:hypothetical protein